MPYADQAKKKSAARASYERTREIVKARTRARYVREPEAVKARVKSWKSRNRDAVQAQHVRERRKAGMLERVTLHDAHVRVWKCPPKIVLQDAHVREFFADDAREYRWRYRFDADFRLKERLRRQLRKKSEAVPGLAEIIRYAMKRAGRSGAVESLLGYSITQLRDHLERQFVAGMTWSCFGKDGWHIDHILPRKCFDLTSLEGVQAYWSLSNLRPLAALANLRKGAKVETLL